MCIFAHMNAKGQDVIYTFYRLGPSFITWFYPIDQTPIEKEILDPDGQIGTEAYEDFPGAIEHLDPFDPKWFRKDGNELVCQILIEDLVYLAEVFGMNGAYSLQAALAKDPDESIFRFRLGAMGGSPECMVGYGQLMCRKGYVTDGWEWIEKGAEKGCEIGMLLAAISYQYGTMSSIDYEKAAYFYCRAIKEFHSFYAFMNYGVMFIEANCCHSALYTLGHAMKQKNRYEKLLEDKDATNLFSNYKSCEALLQFPYEERPKHIAIEYHAPELDAQYCYKGEAPKTVGANGKKPQPWCPEDKRLVPTDVEERNVYQAKIKAREVIMEIDEKYRIFLKYDDGTPIAEVKMPALPKALYFVFLNHPEGFPLKHLIDYRDELLTWYRRLSNRKNAEKYIDKLVDSTGNSANEKISRIREAFEKNHNNESNLSPSFIPLGTKGASFCVTIERRNVKWFSLP